MERNSDPMILPTPVSNFCDALGVPPEDRSERMEIVVSSAFLLEIFTANNRWLAVGVLNELPIPPDAPVLESFLERSPSSIQLGTTSYEPDRQRLTHWMEIPPDENRATSSAASFLSELKEILRFAAAKGVL